MASPARTIINAAGKDVIVIGGGDTGTDCVGTSMRHGCRSLVQLEILPKPPTERAPDNPWPEWPKIYRMDYGQEEAAAKFGERPADLPDDGQEIRRRRPRDTFKALSPCRSSGRRTKAAVSCRRKCPARKKKFRRSWCLLAMGFLGPEQPLLEQLGLERDARSNIKADFQQYTTNLPGVFAAGDCRRGQSLVVWAFNEGRGAARECDRYLMGSTSLP